MSTLPSYRPITIEEFDQLSDIDGIQELLDGEIVQMPPPKRRHSQVCRNVSRMLQHLIHHDRVWMETGFLIGQHCPQPDVSVTFPDQRTERGWFAGAPMIAIEVASRGNTPNELEWKKDLYLANGAHEVWIVYDKTRSVVVHWASGNAMSCRDRFISRALDVEVSVDEIFVSSPA